MKITGTQRLPGGFLPGFWLWMLRTERILGAQVFHTFPAGLQLCLLTAWGRLGQTEADWGGRAGNGDAAERPYHLLNSVDASLLMRKTGPRHRCRKRVQKVDVVTVPSREQEKHALAKPVIAWDVFFGGERDGTLSSRQSRWGSQPH